MPTGCMLSERAIAYPNHQTNTHSSGVACAAGHPIEFHPNGTLAECVLDAEQPEAVTGFAFKSVRGLQGTGALRQGWPGGVLALVELTDTGRSIKACMRDLCLRAARDKGLNRE